MAMETMKTTIPEISITDYSSIAANLLRRHAFSFRKFDVKYMFSAVKAILHRGNSVVESVYVDKSIAELIRKLSCKFACDCSTKNILETVEEILGKKYLSNYDLDAMMVMALAAYAINYSKYRLFVESCATNDLVYKNIWMLKQALEIEYTRKLVVAIDKVMVAAVEMIELAINVVGLRRANNAQISTTSASSVDCVAQAVCHTIHTVVFCASLDTGFVVQDVESTLLTFTNRYIKTTTEALRIEFEATSQQQNEWQIIEDALYNTEELSIEAVLTALIKPDANGTLVIGNDTRTEVRFGHIKGQNVCLLISGGYITNNEIVGIAEIVKETKHQLIWIPISVEPERFKETQCLMNWYTVRDPCHVRPTAISFIQQTWSFGGQTILVPLGQKELKVYPIDWLWSRRKFPVDGLQVSPLPQLSFSYLLEDIYQLEIRNKQPKSPTPIVCLYGGEDCNWIQSFIKLLRDVRSSLSGCQIDIEFVYVSQSEGIDSENTAIFNLLEKEKFGCYWRASGSECWRFWTRVQSFYREQTRVGAGSTNAAIMKEALALLSYNANTKGWAIFGQYGTDFKLAHATGKVAEVVLKMKRPLYQEANSAAFIEQLCIALNEQVKKQASHCSHIMLPASVGDLGNCITCPMCDKPMTKYSYYRCCI